MEPMTELLSAAEAARILGVTRQRVVELAEADPEFPAFQPSPAGGRAWPRAAVEAWAAAHPDRGPLHRGLTLPEVGGRSLQVWTVANLAGADAQALHHDWIGLEHLLAALVHPDCPGAARSVLASLGVTAERLRQARERSFVDPFEPPPAPEPPLDPEEAMGRVAPGLELAVTPAGKDPRRRMPWGSRIFVDADGTRSSRPTARRCGSTTSTGTATRCPPATASQCTPSSMNTAER
jgi:predicted DNA-binding transcriptional regulator AlpA